ncbi:flocculation protein FLO11-like [Cucumis melo var. makuwa]|uniref:Flocculation protein FLO11-like n=1 Tax=Cucumis melo var. makuwa TaxID=1194695 RepID=A0A5A7T7S3_CUCMM|nr:flocculation protein FLO11-like [Cucumis melo var. makuwa]
MRLKQIGSADIRVGSQSSFQGIFGSVIFLSSNFFEFLSRTLNQMFNSGAVGLKEQDVVSRIKRYFDPAESPLTSPIRRAHARRSSDLVSPVIVKREVPDSSPPQSFHQSASSSVPRPRGSVETVVLDSDSSDNEDNVVL